MMSLILNSNHRARVAVLVAKMMNRTPESMAELRDALNQRANMRESARFSLWFMRNEESLRSRFNLWVARYHFRFSRCGDLEKEFSRWIHNEYKNETTP